MTGDSSKNLLNRIFLGEVNKVQDYGAFIQLPGFKQQGLIHRSQISSCDVSDASEVLKKGDRVWCKVININDDGKIGLSMKVVDQGNGRDLDPNGVKIFQDEQKRKAWPPKEGKRTIILQAVYNTTCTKCNTPGHLAKDCFQSPDGKTYQLLPDEVDEPPIPTSTVTESELSKSHHKSKKKKSKKHKTDWEVKKHKKRKGSSYDSSEGSDSTSRKHKKSKKSKRDRS